MMEALEQADGDDSWLGMSKWLWMALLSLGALACLGVAGLYVLKLRGKGEKRQTRGADLDSDRSGRAVAQSENSEEDSGSGSEEISASRPGEEVPLMSGRHHKNSD